MIITESSTVDQSGKIRDALNRIRGTYGALVSVEGKTKDLRKWGLNAAVPTAGAAIMTLPSGITEETLLTSNGVTVVSSTLASLVTAVNSYLAGSTKRLHSMNWYAGGIATLAHYAVVNEITYS